MRARLVVGSVAAVMTAVGCSLLVDTSDLTGRASVDAETGAPDAPGAASDASDAGPIPAVDAATRPDADAASDLCSGYRFCDLFDEPMRAANVRGPWTALDPGAGTVAIAGDGLSLPNSAVFTMPARSAGGDYSDLKTSIALGSDHLLTLEADIKVTVDRSSYAPDAYSPLLFLGVDGAYAGALSIVPNGLNVGSVYYPDGGVGTQRIDSDDKTTSGTWFHILVRETFDPTSGHIHAEIDGRVIVDVDAKTSPTPASVINVSIGAGSAGQTPLLDVKYDNVRIR